MQVDILGIENVIKYIEASKLTKFTIQRAGAGGAYIPVFECIDSDSNANAVNEFTKWAGVVNNAMPYKIVLFNYAEKTTDENGAPKIKKAATKGDKMESTFILNTAQQNWQQPNNTQASINGNNGGIDLATLRADIIKEISKQQEENAILNEIKALKQKFVELESEEEEEEEEEESGTIAGIKPDQVAQILGLVKMLQTNAPPPAINGIDEQKENINKAIKILYKHDKALDTDLLKLADLAENKPDTFKMLLETLRKM